MLLKTTCHTIISPSTRAPEPRQALQSLRKHWWEGNNNLHFIKFFSPCFMLSGDKYFPIMLPYISIYTHTLSCIHTHDKGGKSSRLSAPCRKSRKMSLRQVEKFAFKRQGRGSKWAEINANCLLRDRIAASCTRGCGGGLALFATESSFHVATCYEILAVDMAESRQQRSALHRQFKNQTKPDRLQLQSRSRVGRPFKLFISLEMYLFS